LSSATPAARDPASEQAQELEPALRLQAEVLEPAQPPRFLAAGPVLMLLVRWPSLTARSLQLWERPSVRWQQSAQQPTSDRQTPGRNCRQDRTMPAEPWAVREAFPRNRIPSYRLVAADSSVSPGSWSKDEFHHRRKSVRRGDLKASPTT